MFEQAFLLINLAIGLVWLQSFFEKISSKSFADSLPLTLAKFASKNPYPWYKKYLESFAIPHAKLFAHLTTWGEVVFALAIIFSVLSLLIQPEGNLLATIILLFGLCGGIFLNLNFWLATAWLSQSSNTLNMFMLVIQVISVTALSMSL